MVNLPEEQPQPENVTPIKPAITFEEPIVDQETLEFRKSQNEKIEKVMKTYFGMLEERLLKRLLAITGGVPKDEDLLQFGSMTVDDGTGVRTMWWKGCKILEVGPINDPWVKELEYDPGSSDS